MKITWKNQLFCLVPLVLSIQAVAQVSTLNAISDQELSDIHGQSLLSLTYVAPSDAENKMQGQNTGFYKLGMEAEVKLNANINKLQLGCGGVNGVGDCDIDIDNLSFSGISDTREGRAGSSAVMTNPFIEFAIKNPDSASKREVVGLRLSAEKVLGLLTMGDENTDKPNGINSLSGFMKIKDAKGTAFTGLRTNVSPKDLDNLTINGRARSTDRLLNLSFASKEYSLNLGEASGPLSINGKSIFGNRMKNVNLQGETVINNIPMTGSLKTIANIEGIAGFIVRILIPSGEVPINGSLNGSVSNLKVKVDVDQSLGLIHKLQLNNPFSLSLQNDSVWWPGAEVAAQRGWWMAFEDAIDIGNVTPSKRVDVTNDVVKQVIPLVNNYLQSNPLNCGILAVSCAFGSFNVGNVPLNNSTVSMSLNNLQLANQNFAPNCYGNLKFC